MNDLVKKVIQTISIGTVGLFLTIAPIRYLSINKEEKDDLSYSQLASEMPLAGYASLGFGIPLLGITGCSIYEIMRGNFNNYKFFKDEERS